MILERRMEGVKIDKHSAQKALRRINALRLAAIGLALAGGMAGCGKAPTPPVTDSPPPQISDAHQPRRTPPDTCGLAVFRQGALFGYLDCHQDTAFPAVWDYAAPFNPDFGYAIVRQGETFGVIDRKGNWAITPFHTFLQDIGEGFFAVADTQHRGFAVLDPQGQRLLPFPLNPVYPFEGGYAMGRVSGKLLIFDVGGRVSAEIPDGRPVKGQPPGIIAEGKVAINVNGRLGYWKVTGEQLTPTEYDQAYPYSEGRARVMQNGKIGYLNELGQMAIPPQFSDATDFQSGVAGVQLADGPDRGNWRLIRTDGQWATPALFARIQPFQHGVGWAARRESGMWGLISPQGIGLNLPEYDGPGLSLTDSLFVVTKGGKWGAIALDGTVRVPFQYDQLLPFKNGVAEFQQAGKWGLVNNRGEEKVPAQYTDVARFQNGLFLFLSKGTVQDYFDQQWHFKPEMATFYTHSPVKQLP